MVAVAVVESGVWFANSQGLLRESICTRESTWRTGVEKSDLTCVNDGQPPPKGHTTFPPGEMPQFVDEIYPDE
jgi:hypothetical protein